MLKESNTLILAPSSVIPPLILALDIGSTAVRVGLYDRDARPVPTVQTQITRTPAPDGIENPVSLTETVETAITKTLAIATREQTALIAGFGMATFAGNFMGISGTNEACTPLYTYAHPGGGDEVRELDSLLKSDKVHQRTGAPIHTSYQGPTILWLKKRDPFLVKKVVRWVDFGTYLYTRWFGRTEIPTSYSIASWSGLLNRATLGWDQELTGHLGLGSNSLPMLSDYDIPINGLTHVYAERWPVLAKIPFFLPVGDGACANIGVGCGDSRDIALTIGTTGAMRATLNETPDRIPRGLWSYSIDQKMSLIGGAITDAGSLLSWLHRTLRLGGEYLLNDEIANAEPGSHGLTILPFLRGERSPGWSTEATATWHGIRASTTPSDFVLASLEALSYRLCLIERLLGQTGQNFNKIITNGSAITKLPIWMQMLADILQKPVVASAINGATSRGIAIMALTALRELKSYSDLPAQNGKEYVPNLSVGHQYQDGFEKHISLYHKLIS